MTTRLLLDKERHVIRVFVNEKLTSLKLSPAQPFEVRMFIKQGNPFSETEVDAKMRELETVGETEF